MNYFVAKCECGENIQEHDLIADGGEYLAYQCSKCLKIFYHYSEPCDVAKPKGDSP